MPGARRGGGHSGFETMRRLLKTAGRSGGGSATTGYLPARHFRPVPCRLVISCDARQVTDEPGISRRMSGPAHALPRASRSNFRHTMAVSHCGGRRCALGTGNRWPMAMRGSTATFLGRPRCSSCGPSRRPAGIAGHVAGLDSPRRADAARRAGRSPMLQITAAPGCAGARPASVTSTSPADARRTGCAAAEAAGDNDVAVDPRMAIGQPVSVAMAPRRPPDS